MRLRLANVADTATLSLAPLAVGTIAASAFVGRIGSNWPIIFDESGRPMLEPDLPIFQHVALTLTNAAEALAIGCVFFFLSLPALLGLVATVFLAVLTGSGKLSFGTAALWLAVAMALVEFGGFQIMDLMSA
jgi:hypothetical protein